MAKQNYTIPEDSTPVASEPPSSYSVAPDLPVPCQITVNIEDVRMLKEIKKAISMIRGVVSVEKSPAMKSYERARADVDAGRVVEFDDLDALKAYYDTL